jgi:two-component system cell cycle sensor histidine kinase/response regulator CckA
MILVVDDEEYVLRLADAILTRSGFDVLIARKGQAALDAARMNAGRIGVVLLDIYMPDIDGIALVPMLLETDPNIGIVLTSGYLGENVLSKFGPGVSFLQKPYNVDKLIAAVEAALAMA